MLRAYQELSVKKSIHFELIKSKWIPQIPTEVLQKGQRFREV